MSGFALYDLPTKGEKPGYWMVYNIYTRLALNFKNLPFETIWLEYPDVEPTLKPLVTPNQGSPIVEYTVPTLRFPDNTYVVDSKAIAAALEAYQPTPLLHLNSPLIDEATVAQKKIQVALRGVWMPRVPAICNEPSREYFVRKRAEQFKPLPQMAREDGGEEAWENAVPAIKELEEVIMRNGGPFALGESPSYVDFVAVGELEMLRVIGEDIFTRVIGISPELGKLYEASKQWL